MTDSLRTAGPGGGWDKAQCQIYVGNFVAKKFANSPEGSPPLFVCQFFWSEPDALFAVCKKSRPLASRPWSLSSVSPAHPRSFPCSSYISNCDGWIVPN